MYFRSGTTELKKTDFPTAGIMSYGMEAAICGQDDSGRPLEIVFNESDRKIAKRVCEIVSGGKFFPDWISVKDELPRLMQSVLYFDGTVDAGWYSAKRKFMNYDTCREATDVSYWMPMPEPPEADKPIATCDDLKEAVEESYHTEIQLCDSEPDPSVED